jgi:hypothetical protein
MKKDFNKTAMQELIERLERNIKEMPNEVNTFTQGYKAGLNFVIECATTSLEKEKEQIYFAFISGCIEAISYQTPVRDRIKEGYFEDKAEQYINYTYNQNDNETNF